MKLSRRAASLPESPIRKLVPYADDAKKRGVHVYHLNIGQPDIKTPREYMSAINSFDVEVLEYGPSNGLLDYRLGLSQYYAKWGIQLNENQIFVTTAGSEAILFAMIAVADPGDDTLVMEPFYTNYNGFGAMADVSVIGVPTRADDGFAIPDISVFEKRLTPRTRAIMVCNPNNPTGAVYPEKDLRRLAEFARENDLFIISDEVYREFTYNNVTHTSILQLDEFRDRSIMVDSISKRYSACGARIGCICSYNEDLLNAAMKMGQARLCPPTLEQIGARAAIEAPDEYLTGVVSEYEKRRDVLFDALQKIDGVFCKKPDGAFYMMVTLPVDDADRFARFMLESFEMDKQTVMFAPGGGFYATPGMGANQVRMAYVLKTEDLIASAKLLEAGLKAYNNHR